MRILALSRTVLLLACLLSACKSNRAGADGPIKPAGIKTSGEMSLAGEFSYAGKAALNRGANRITVAELLDLPQSLELRRVTLDKLATSLPSLLISSATNAEIGQLLRPLLEDVLDVPSRAQAVRFSSSESAQWFYGFHLSADRAQIWETNLWKAANLANSAALHSIRNERFSGWKLSLTNENAFVFGRVGSWAVLTLGKRLPGPSVPFLADFAKGHNDGENPEQLLELRLKRGTEWIDTSFLKEQKVSELNLSIRAQRLALRSELKITFDKGRHWSLEPWLIPTNTIKEPLIAFTAIQGLSNWFAGQKVVQTLQLHPAPNQLFLWAQSHTMFSYYAAIHQPENTNALERFSKKVLPDLSTNLVKNYGGEFQWISNLSGAFWHGLPAMVPFIRPGAEADGDVVVAGLFPAADNSSTLPAELIGQVAGRTNLLYYDWEVLPPRVVQVNQLARMLSALQFRQLRAPERPSDQWLEAISPKLGNTITEATLDSPEEISIVRRSVMGLSSVELVAFARWIEHPAFPRIVPDFWLEPKKTHPPDHP